MILELQQYFGRKELITLIKNIMLRKPVIFYHKGDDKKIYDLISLGAPHRFFAALAKPEAEDVEKIFASEKTESSKRIVLLLKNPIELPKSGKGWIAQIEYRPTQEMLRDFCTYDLETRKFLNREKCAMNIDLSEIVEKYIARLTSFEDLYGASETKIFASNFIEFMISQIKIIANFTLTKQRDFSRDDFRKEIQKTISSVFTFKGFFTLALEIFSSEYHNKLKETLEDLKIDSMAYDRTVNPEFKTHFIELKKIFGTETILKLVEYTLMGFPIVIRASKNLEDKLFDSLAYIVRHRKIFFEYPKDKAVLNTPHFIILKNAKKLPPKDFDFIATTNEDNVIDEIHQRDFYAVLDLKGGNTEFSHEFPDFLKEAFELNQESILVNYLDSQINRISILTDLLEVTAKNIGYTKSLLMVSSKEEHLSDWLVLVALLRTKKPSNEFLSAFLKVASATKLTSHAYYIIKNKKKISVELLENLLSNTDFPEIVFHIIGGQGISIYDLLTNRLRRTGFSIWETLEKLLKEGIIEIE